MVVLNYSKYDVLAMFAFDGGKVNPTAQEIVEFDAGLFNGNEEILLEIMADEGIEARKDVKSTILLYSRFNSGNLRQKIRRACKYFKNVKDL